MGTFPKGTPCIKAGCITYWYITNCLDAGCPFGERPHKSDMEIILKLFLTGLLFGSGPCLVSCGPMLAAYIAGRQLTPLQTLTIYFIFSFFRIAVYLVLSIAVFFFGKTAAESIRGSLADYMLIIAGFLLIIFGFYFIYGKRLEIKPFNYIYRFIIKGDSKNLAVLGIVAGLLPCAPFMAVLAYIGLVSNTLHQNLIYTLSFGIGTMISALLLVASAAGFIPVIIKNKKEIYSRIVRIASGVVIIFLGIQLFRGAFL